MKKVFFLIHSMDVGGVEKALLGVLSVLPLKQLEVHVGLLHHRGDFLKSLPTEVKIQDVCCYDKYWQIINDPPLSYIKSFAKEGRIIDAIVYLLLYIQRKMNGDHYWTYRYMMRKEPIYPNETYDLAACFAGPSQMMDYYICNHVKAKVKCNWIHFDISEYGIDKGMMSKLYQKYQRIFIVSETGKAIFDQTFPQFKNKTEVFHNVVLPSQIRDLALVGETFNDDFKGKRILTVGRISPEKGQREAIYALKLLVDKGFNLRWYFIGEGIDLENCKNVVNELGLSEYVVFLGMKTNPYGYMRDCDVYMQPSRHEGFCITLAEALCFGNPIVATDFTGAKEQLRNRSNSFVVGMKSEDITSGLEEIWNMQSSDCVNMEFQQDIHKLLDLLI